jgi:hypothetical protein
MTMLTLRREQMQVLERYALEQFVGRMSARLRAVFRRETGNVAEPELRALIRQAIGKAATHGVSDEVDVARYLEFVIRHGPEFDMQETTAWAGLILQRTDLSGTEKMNASGPDSVWGIGAPHDL